MQPLFGCNFLYLKVVEKKKSYVCRDLLEAFSIMMYSIDRDCQTGKSNYWWI